MTFLAKGKIYKLANGEPVEVVSAYSDRIVVLYNGVRFDRPADLIGSALFPVQDVPGDAFSDAQRKASVASFTESRSPDHMRRKVIHEGDTVCIRFVEEDRKAVYTLTNDEKLVTIRDDYPDEGVLSERSSLGIALLGMGTNDVITFYDHDRVILIQILSFFLKKEGIYQRMKEQKEAQKLQGNRAKKRKPEERVPHSVSKVRTIRTGDTVCVEFLDTKEKKAFQIVEAWVETHGEFAAKPYRPTSYDSKTITDANPDEDTISEASPLARAVIGKKRGDVTSFSVGASRTDVRIIAFFDNDTWLKRQKNFASSDEKA